MHYGTQPFKCPVEGCNKAFSEKQNLKTHMLIHQDARPFPCPKNCGLSFRTKGNMMDHLRRHYNVRPFKCEHCGIGFYRKNILKRHQAECKGVPENKTNELTESSPQSDGIAQTGAHSTPWSNDQAVDSSSGLGKTATLSENSNAA